MKLIKLNAIDSTNDYLKSLCREVVLDDGVVVVALHQTGGRGQTGTQWYFKPGKSLAFSVFRRFSGLKVTQQFAINCAVSIGLKKGLDFLGIPDVWIKWPNDILAGGKKVCGILIENQVQGSLVASSVIGVGVNVNNESFQGLPRAGSLASVAGKTFDIEQVLQEMVFFISSELNRVNPQEISGLQSDYENDLFRKNKISEFTDARGHHFKATIEGVSSMGQLCLKMENGVHRQFTLKELELLY